MRKSELRSITLHGIFLEMTFWLGFCAYMSFTVTTLVDYGWSSGAAAGVMTAMAVIAMIAQPLCGYIIDHLMTEKKFVVLMLAVTILCMGLLPFSLDSGNSIFILANFVGITLSGVQLGGVMDAWIVSLKQEHEDLNYGLIRGCGSIAYAVSAQLMGTVTSAFGHSVRTWLGCGFLLLAVLSALTFQSAKKGVTASSAQEKKHDKTGTGTLKILFASKQYRLLLIVSFFLVLSSASMLTLLQLIIPSLGGTASQIGTATAVMSISEVPCMFLMAFFIRKFGEKKLIVAAGFFYTVRMIITASVGSIPALIAVQAFQGLTYAVLQPVAMSYLARTVDIKVRSTAVTTYAAISSSFAAILGSAITSSVLSAGFSAQTTLIVFAVSASIGLVLALYGYIRKIW